MVVRFGIVYNKADGDDIQKGRRCRVPKIIADMKVQFVCAADKGVIGRNGAVYPPVFVGMKFVHDNQSARRLDSGEKRIFLSRRRGGHGRCQVYEKLVFPSSHWSSAI